VTPAGTLDPTFGTAGLTQVTARAASAGADSLGTLPNNRLVLAYTATSATARAGKLVALDAGTGSLDPAFGSNGRVTTGLSVTDTLRQGTGRLLVSGQVLPADPQARPGRAIVQRRVVSAG